MTLAPELRKNLLLRNLLPEYPPERKAPVEQQLREELELAWIAYQHAPAAEKAEAKRRYLAALVRFTELVLRF